MSAPKLVGADTFVPTERADSLAKQPVVCTDTNHQYDDLELTLVVACLVSEPPSDWCVRAARAPGECGQ